MSDIKVGSWAFPSGNSVDVTFQRGADGLGHIRFWWDNPPPLEIGDLHFYLNLIRPEVIRRVQQYLEQPGRVLVVTIF